MVNVGWTIKPQHSLGIPKATLQVLACNYGVFVSNEQSAANEVPDLSQQAQCCLFSNHGVCHQSSRSIARVPPLLRTQRKRIQTSKHMPDDQGFSQKTDIEGGLHAEPSLPRVTQRAQGRRQKEPVPPQVLIRCQHSPVGVR